MKKIKFILQLIILAYCGLNLIELRAVEVTPKEGEAIYQELMTFPQFKAVDGELSSVYRRAREAIDPNSQMQLRDEQRAWIKSRDQAILSTPRDRRLDAAITMTLGRITLLGGRGLTAGANSSRSEVSVQKPPPISASPVSKETGAQDASRGNSQSDESLVTVVNSKGQGETPEKAERSALLRAVVKAVGALVDQETLVKNDELVRDQILSVSSGFVKSFKVVQAAKKNLEGDFETVLEVVVEKRKLERSLSEKGLVKAISNAKDVWAETLSKNVTAEDAIRMLEAKLPSLIERLFSVSFFEDSPKPVLLSKDSSKNTAKLLWWVKLSSDTKFWYSQAAPMLETCLSAIAENEKDDTSLERGNFLNFAIAVTQPAVGSEVDPKDFKLIKTSRVIGERINNAFGIPGLSVKLKAEGDVVSSAKLNPNSGVAEFARLFNTYVSNLSSPALGNFRGGVTNNQSRLLIKSTMRGVTVQSEAPESQLNKFIDSKPTNFSLGGTFFMFSSLETVRITQPSPSYYFAQQQAWGHGGQGPSIAPRNRDACRFFVPETVISGNSSDVRRLGAIWWRAPRPGVVAFPVILDVPIEETKNTLELSVKITSSLVDQKSDSK